MHTHPRALPSFGAGSRPPGLPPVSPPLRRSCPSAWELLCRVPSPRPHATLWGSSYHGPPRPARSPPPGPHPIRIAVCQHPIPRPVAQHRCKQKVKETASGLGLQSLCFSFQARLTCVIALSKVAVAYWVLCQCFHSLFTRAGHRQQVPAGLKGARSLHATRGWSGFF